MKYTRRQIVEAIRYWTAVLEAGNYKRINWPRRIPGIEYYTGPSSVSLHRDRMVNKMLVVLARLAGVEKEAADGMAKYMLQASAIARQTREKARKTLFDSVMREYGFKPQLPEYPARSPAPDDGKCHYDGNKAQKAACHYDVAALFAQEYEKRKGDPAELQKMSDLCDQVDLDIDFASKLSSLDGVGSVYDQMDRVGGRIKDKTMYDLGMTDRRTTDAYYREIKARADAELERIR